MDWWDYESPATSRTEEEDNSKITWTQKFCTHDWKATQLIVSTVYDCRRCSVRKEDFDDWERGKK